MSTYRIVIEVIDGVIGEYYAYYAGMDHDAFNTSLMQELSIGYSDYKGACDMLDILIRKGIEPEKVFIIKEDDQPNYKLEHKKRIRQLRVENHLK